MNSAVSTFMVRWILAIAMMALVLHTSAHAQSSPVARAYYQNQAQQRTLGQRWGQRQSSFISRSTQFQRMQQRAALMLHRASEAQRTRAPQKSSASMRPGRIQTALMSRSRQLAAQRISMLRPRSPFPSAAPTRSGPFARLFRGDRLRGIPVRAAEGTKHAAPVVKSAAPSPSLRVSLVDGRYVVVRDGRTARLPRGNEIRALARLIEKQGLSSRRARRVAKRALRQARQNKNGTTVSH